MGRMKKVWLSEPVLAAFFLVSLLVALFGAVDWLQIYRLGQDIASPQTVTVTEETRPEVVFAAAASSDQRGDFQQALSLYGSIQQAGDARFRTTVRYNMATIYLREAARTWNAVGVIEHARVNTLVQLAKENYQAVLRLDPDHWDARFNLEYAYRITPPPKERSKADFQGTKSSVFSTLPSVPGGGP